MNPSLEKTNQEMALTHGQTELPVDISWGDLQVAISGNLAKLSAEGQVKYYNALCKFTGLNPLGFPFEWITFQGKLKLYPKKECADQLRDIRKINIKLIERVMEHGMCITRVEASTPDGRTFPATGAVPFADSMPVLERCKALKVSETQAARRATFGLVGLSNIANEDSPEETQVTAVVEHLGEESAGARAEKLNQALTEGDKKEAIEISESREPSTPASSPATPASERGSQPLSSPTISAVPPSAENPAQFSPPKEQISPSNVSAVNPALETQPAGSHSAPDNFPDPEFPIVNNADEERARNLEIVFSERQELLQKNAIELLSIIGDLPRGKGLEGLKLETATEILKDPAAFFKWVEQVIGWLIFKRQLKENEPIKNITASVVTWISSNPARLRTTVKQWADTNKR